MAEPTRTAPTLTRRPEVGTDRRRAARRHLDDLTELPTPPTGGRPLPPEVARVAGARLGVDLSGIRLHHDWFAHELAEALAAQAVTEGAHIYLAADAPDPATPAGRLLLAHEFVHAAYPMSSSAPAEEEAAAERAGMAAARQWDAASAATPPELSPKTAENSLPDSGFRDLAAASLPADPGGLGDRSGIDHPSVLGRLGRLGRRTRATLVRQGSEGGVLPDVVSAGEALVRLVGRLFDRDSEDHGGRLTSVLARLEPRLRDDVVTEVAARSGGHAETKLHELAHQRPPEDGGYAAGESAAAGASDSVTTADRDGSTPVPGTPDADAAAEPSAPTGMDPAAVAEQSSGAPEPAKADAPTGSGTAQAADGDELPDQDSIEERPPAPAALHAPTTQGAQTESGPTSPTASTAAASKPAAAPAPGVPTGGEAPAVAGGGAGAGVAADSTSVGGEGLPRAGAGPATITDAAGEAPAAATTATEATAADGASNAPSDARGAAADASSTAGSGPMAPTGADAEEPQSEAETETVPEPAAPTPSPEQHEGPLASAAAAPAEVAEPTGTDPGLVGDAGQDAADQAESDATADVPTEPAGGPPEPEAGPVPAEPTTADDEQGAEPDARRQDAGSDSVQAAASPTPSAPPTATLESEPSQGGVVSPELTAGTPADAAPESDVAAGTAAAEDTPAFDSDAPAVPAASVGDPASIAAAAGISPADTGDAGTLTDPAAPSGGEGGGSAIADPPEAQAPDVSAMDPQAALSAVAGLPATKLAGSLGEVSGTAGREIAEGNADLAANPPSMERPSGVPADRDASLPTAALPPLPVGKDRVLNGIAGGPGAEPPSPAEAPTFPAPVTVRVPEVTAGGDTQVSAEDAQRVQTAVRALPTSDPALEVDAGPVPQLELSGGEDPHQVEDQAGSVEEATSGVQSEGLTDARADMGENDVFPQVPKETLAADVGSPGGPTGGGVGGTSPGAPSPGNAPSPGKAAAPAASGLAGGGPAAAAGGPGAGGAPATGGGKEAPPAAIDAVVAEQSADQVAGSARDQGAALGAARQDHDTSAEQAKAETDKEINDEIAANGGEQTAARRNIRTSVGQQRKDWVGEQDRIAGDSRTAAVAAAGQAQHDIGDARATARTDAGSAIEDGNSTIVKERTKAEQSAREEREKAERESDDGGFFSWLGSKIKSFVNKIKSAIHAVFELARKAVDAAISAAQKLAVAAIELGRRAVVAAIDVAGKALMAAGDIALAAFPETRKKFRAKIQEKVDGAKKAVNELADKLKAGVKKLLDALGGLLKGALTLLEKAYTAAIDAVGKVIDSAIKAAKAFVDALLDFAALIADIAADPVQWIKNLAAGFMDGVHNYVWSSLITAVKNWFKEKVEEIVGVGSMILDLLRKGGITFVKIVSMAWTAIKESLPGIVIQLLIEKLVAMLIPAGGAISLIIDGIKAAWGAASKILAAFGKFIAFLKAVKSGKSGPLFGDLVGAAAVAVMDFLANFVLSKLKGAGQKVGGTLRKMAEKIMKAVKKVAGAIKAGAKAAVGAIKRGAKAAVGLVKKGAKAATGALRRGAGKVAGAVKRGVTAVARAVRRVVPKGVLKAGARAIGKVRDTVKAGYRKAKAAYTKAKEKLFGKKKPKKPKETPQEKLSRVVGIIGPQIQGWFDRGIGRVGLFAGLTALQVRHRLRSLKSAWAGHRVTVRARVNPEADTGAVAWSPGSELRRLVSEVAEELLRDPTVAEAGQSMRGKGGTAAEPIEVKSGADYLAATNAMAGQVDRTKPTFLRLGAGTDASVVKIAPRTRNVRPETLDLFRNQAAAGGESGPPVTAGQTADLLRLLPHRYVNKGGKYGTSFDRQLGEVGGRSTPKDPSGLGALVGFMQTGEAGQSTKQTRENLAAMSALTFIQEPSRDPAHLADMAMANGLVGQKKGRLAEVLGGSPDDIVTTKDLFSGAHRDIGGGGILPLTAKGAQGAAFDLQAKDFGADLERITGPGGSPDAALGEGAGIRGENQPRPSAAPPRQGAAPENDPSIGAENLARRRMLLAERWVEVKMRADPEAFKDRESAKVTITTELRRFYGLAVKAPVGQLPGGGS